jgi:hypothetical protein
MQVRQSLLDLAHIRSKEGGDVRVVWNAEYPPKTPACHRPQAAAGGGLLGRDGGDSCSLAIDGGDLTFAPGEPSPVCPAASIGCGELCKETRFCIQPCKFCGESPEPDFFDPTWQISPGVASPPTVPFMTPVAATPDPSTPVTSRPKDLPSSNPSPTKPPPPSHTVLLMRLESQIPGGGSVMTDWQREWYVYGEEVHRASDTCPSGIDVPVPIIGEAINAVSSLINVLKGNYAKPIYKQQTNQALGDYPYNDVGPFQYAGTKCTYKAKSRDVIGTLSCADGRQTVCKKDQSSWAYCGVHINNPRVPFTLVQGYSTTPSLQCIL